MIQAQNQVLSPSESATGEERNGQDEVEGHNVSKERKEIEQGKKPIDNGPMDNVEKRRKKGKANKPVGKGPMNDYFKPVDRGV